MVGMQYILVDRLNEWLDTYDLDICRCRVIKSEYAPSFQPQRFGFNVNVIKCLISLLLKPDIQVKDSCNKRHACMWCQPVR